MWNWYSGDESQSPATASNNQQSAGTMSVADLTEQLAQTQQLVAQLKELIREKDGDLRKKDQQLKEEKESSESKISKAKLQNKAKIASLTSQLEDLKKQLASAGAEGKKSENKKGSSDGDQENASANRGKILVLKKRAEELENQLSLKNEALQKKEAELEAQRLRGSEIDTMLVAKEKKLAEKEAYIIDLQMSVAANREASVLDQNVKITQKESDQDLQILIQNLTRKVGESEEKYSLLDEQTESLKALLNKEKSEFQEKEAMYAENIRVYQNMILEKDKAMKELSQRHDQEIFKLAAKSDASADLHQLLKALKQKLHEEEEVLLGKNQVIDVLQKELDNKDQQIAEMNEKYKRVLSEKENLQSKMDAEKHVMRAQLKDMMEKHETALRRLGDQHSTALQEKSQTIQQLQNQLQSLASPGETHTASTEPSESEIMKLQGEVKLKTEESEIKNHELSQLNLRISELENEKRDLEVKLESVVDRQALNEQLLAKLVVYEEQQRKLQADLEQVAKRADSQTSESGSVDELHNQLEWSEMGGDNEITADQETQETSVIALRMAQIEEEREAMDSGQVELEEELSAARGVGKLRPTRRKGSRGTSKMQDELYYNNKSFEEQNLTMESNESVEGENMGGLRAVVEELELERNQLQEQIMALEERCQELEDRLQLQLRIETLQSDNERMQTQLVQLRQQQNQEAEKHHDLLATLNDQIKGLAIRNTFLENAIVEKEQTIMQATTKLDQLMAVKKSLHEKESSNKELYEKLDQCQHQLEELTKKQKILETENSALKLSNSDLTEKVSAFKERVFIQDSSLEKLQLDLDQTNEELDRLNTSHLEERSQLIHDLQRCEREMDMLKEVLLERDTEMSSLSSSLAEYSEQVTILKGTVDFKDEQMREMSEALVKMERERHLIREAQSTDVQQTSAKVSSLTEQLNEVDIELSKVKNQYDGKSKEAEELLRQLNENDVTIKNLRQDNQMQSVTHNNHITECSGQIASLKEQIGTSAAKVSETETRYTKEIESLKLQLEKDLSERERLSGLLQEQGKKEQNFEKELKTLKEQFNKTVSEMSRKDGEIEQLSTQLGELRDRHDKLDKELHNRLEELSSLQQKLETLTVEREEAAKTLQEKKLQLQQQTEEKLEIINKFTSEKEELLSQNKLLEMSLAEKDTNLQIQINSVEEFGRKNQGLGDRNRELSNERDHLLVQVSQKENELSSLNQSLQDVQGKLSGTERQLSEKQKLMSDLLRDKEELVAKLEIISAQSLHNDSLVAAKLEEKTKECLKAKLQLQEEHEVSLKLKTQMESLENDLKEAKKNHQEKNEALKASLDDYKTACEQLKQNQEKSSQLEKQVEKLNNEVELKKRELQEKDVIINTQHAQVEETRSKLESLQTEQLTLKDVNLKITEHAERLNTEIGRLQQEMSSKTEENTTLTETLLIRSNETVNLTQERDACLSSISNLKTLHETLQAQILDSQTVIESFKQQINTVTNEKDNLKSVLEQQNITLSSKSEEIVVLSSHLSQQSHTILSLKDQIDTLQMDNQSLRRSIQERDGLLLQKEELIRQTEMKLEGEGYHLQTIAALQNELQSSVSDLSQQQQKSKDQEQELQKLSQHMQLLKDKGEEAELLKSQLSEHMEVISDLHSQLRNLRENVKELNVSSVKKDECLKEKVDSYLNLKAQFSGLQDSLEAQRKDIEALMLDNTKYKAALAEKDLSLKNSLLECEQLTEKLLSKEEQCEMLIKQMTDREEISRKQNNDLNELKASIKEQETSFLIKEESLNAQLEQQTKLGSDYQNTVQELRDKITNLEQSVVCSESTVQNLQDKYASLYEQKQELVESLRSKDGEISKLLSLANEKDGRMLVLESSVQAVTSEVNVLREELSKGSTDFRNISEALRLKDGIISQQQNVAEVLKADLETVKAEYSASQTQLNVLSQERDERNLFVHSLQEKMTLQNQLIERLNYDLNSLNSRLLQDQQAAALEKEQLVQKLEYATQEKSQIEKLLQAEREMSLSAKQKQQMEKAEITKELEVKFQHQAKQYEERICSSAEDFNRLKAENADLQKQVSGHVEEISALKLNLENLEHNRIELQQQSEKQFQQLNELNAILREQNGSLENEIKVKESAVEGLVKDLCFVEDKLYVLCDETFSPSDFLDLQSGYKSKVGNLSPMLCKALDYKSKVSELKEALEAKDQEIEQKSQSAVLLEQERERMQDELQKVREEKLGYGSVIEELSVAKETLSCQQSILQDKEEVLQKTKMRVETLQEEVRLTREDLQKAHTLLSEERTKVMELIVDAEKKDDIVQNFSVQLSQQRELISTLSNQVKEKDASLMQIMETTSNEMVIFSEEKSSLCLELQTLQSARSSCLIQISELSERLEACKMDLQQSQQIIADKETSLHTLTNEKDLQLEKFSKERENLKRKLQAALVIRKDLMQKIEKLEQSRLDDSNDEQLKINELRKSVEDLKEKLESAHRQNEELQSQVQHAKQELLEKDAKLGELCSMVSERENNLIELQSKITELEQNLSIKENICQEYLKTIQEKEQNDFQTKNVMKEKLKILEEENSHLVENLENLKSCLEKAQGKLDSQQTSVTGVSVSLESCSPDSSFTHAENSIVHNNVHASLLCNQGNFEGKEKHAALIRSLSSSVKEFELLQKAHTDLQSVYEAKCKEYDQQRDQTLSLQNQIRTQQELLFQREADLASKTLEIEEQRQRTEEMTYKLEQLKEYEDQVFELKSSIKEKDAELIRINTEHADLLSEIQLLKTEIQKLSCDIEQKQQEIHCLKTGLDSRYVDLEKMRESLTNEIIFLQKELEASRTANDSIQLTILQITNEKDTYFEECQANQIEISKLRYDLSMTIAKLLEKDKEIAMVQHSLQVNMQRSEEETEKLQSKLKDYQEEVNHARAEYEQIRGELEECVSKLDKANAEISEFRTKLKDSRKEDEIMVQASTTQQFHNSDLNQVVPERKPTLDNLQAENCLLPVCEDCCRKQEVIEELERQVLKTTSAMEDVIQDRDRKISEESNSREHVHRKLQAALVSRKDLMKENKMLKQKVESLNFELDGLKQSSAEINDVQISKISLFADKTQNLILENERLLSVNENLSAACESLKSTMESIVQEKEAFSFQLNSLKDSQTVELTGWKAKHAELNNEYESLLQAYENVSDEIDKMRQVIDMTKKEKSEVLVKFHNIQSENQELVKQIAMSGEEIDKLQKVLESSEEDIHKLKLEADQVSTVAEKTSQFDEISQQNLKLIKENKSLKETCGQLKICLENKEKESNSLFMIKTSLDKLQMDMNMYKSDMELKISEMTSENDDLSKKVSELNRKLLETERNLATIEAEKFKLLETVESSELLLKQEKDNLLNLKTDLNNLQLEKMNLGEKVKILEDDKALLLDELENIQEQFCKVKNERENLELDLLKAVKNNSLLSDKFKSLQAQTNVLSQQVEFLRAEKNNIVREKEEHQLQVLRDLEERVKNAQDDNRGAKSKSKELQELLKEKQQEINQLHQDSIQFQELILDLEGAVKASNSQNESLKKELERTSSQLTQSRNDLVRLAKDSTSLKSSQVSEAANELIPETQMGNSDSSRLLPKNSGFDRIVQPLDNSVTKASMTFGNVDERDWNTFPELESDVHSNHNVLQSSKSESKSPIELLRIPQEELKAIQDVIAKTEQEYQLLKLENEKIRADLQKQVIISQHMKQIIDNKDKEISVLISSKDGEISNYLEQIQSQYRKQMEDYEHHLSTGQSEKERSDLECKRTGEQLRNLQERYEKALNEKTVISNEIEAFRKSMSSLQTDRDQLCSELKRVHERNEAVLNEKDGIILSTANENSAFKQELRSVLNQIDDLNAENAMLGAQLVRYREDLNQVLSLKDHQLKELLRQKLDHIKNLEQEKCVLQKQTRDMQNANGTLLKSTETLQSENQKLISKVKDQEMVIAAINKQKILFELNKKNASTISFDSQNNGLDVNSQGMLDFGQNSVDLDSDSNRMEKKMDKTYWDIFLENKDLISQNESFGKAMAALQNNRDSLIEDFKELQWKYASELKTEKIRAEDLEKLLGDLKSQLYGILKRNSLLDRTLLNLENNITPDQLVAEIDSLCSVLISRGLEVARISSECDGYVQQIDAFSKAMASLQRDRERLLQQLKGGTLVREDQQGDASVNMPQDVTQSEDLTMTFTETDTLIQATELMHNSAAEALKLRTRVEELEGLQQEAASIQQKLQTELSGYQCEMADLRSEKSFLVVEVQALRHQLNMAVAEKDHQISEPIKYRDIPSLGNTSDGAKVVERVALVGNPAVTEKMTPLLETKEPAKIDTERYLQEIHHRDLIIQQINSKVMESAEMNATLSTQLKSMSQGLKDSQTRYTDLQNQYYKLQRDYHSSQATNRSDIAAEVPPGAPQERANILVEIDNVELVELRRRLAETELHHDSIQQELSQLSERLAEERARREAVEEALHLTEQQNNRLETKTSSRDYEFSLQMESDDEREALIIDPTQNVVMRKIKGGTLSIRRWLRGRSLYCSKLLTSRSKSRYLFLIYLLGIHVLILMCLTGAL